MTLHITTPLYHSIPLSLLGRQQVYLKMEAYQPTGSFKIRGIGRLCEHAAEAGIEKFVSSSGGNAGVAAAYAGRKLGIPVDVYLPSTANEVYVKAITNQGAKTIKAGDAWDDAHQHALQAAQSPKIAYIPPFDHPLIWRGHASIITEVQSEGIQPDAVLVAVGGGGLCCGVLEGLHSVGWENIPVFTVETEGAASFARSVAANEHITLEKIETIATTLGAKRICDTLWTWRNRHRIHPLTVSDADAVDAIARFADDHRTLLEPASASVLVPVYQQNPVLAEFKNILVIICGGVGVSLELLQQWQTRFHSSSQSR